MRTMFLSDNRTELINSINGVRMPVDREASAFASPSGALGAASIALIVVGSVILAAGVALAFVARRRRKSAIATLPIAAVGASAATAGPRPPAPQSEETYERDSPFASMISTV